MTQQEMHEYGYTWDGMLPLNKDEAIDIFTKDMYTVYALHTDDSEAQVDSIDDIEKHAYYGGIFGVEKYEVELQAKKGD